MRQIKRNTVIALFLCTVLLSGCGSSREESQKGINGVPFEALISETVAGTEDDAVEEYGYLPAEWSENRFSRNGCSGYPLVLDNPLKKCKGFTVDYEVSDIEGRMKKDSKFQIFYRVDDGTWVKGKTFYLDDWSASVQQTISKSVTVKEVVVLCLNAGNFSWSVQMGVRDPIY